MCERPASLAGCYFDSDFGSYLFGEKGQILAELFRSSILIIVMSIRSTIQSHTPSILTVFELLCSILNRTYVITYKKKISIDVFDSNLDS